jgi:hypothetical protein
MPRKKGRSKEEKFAIKPVAQAFETGGFFLLRSIPPA